jgi:hypothetical protein
VTAIVTPSGGFRIPSAGRAPSGRKRKLSKPDLGGVTVRMSGEPTREEMREWQRAQINYPNLADDDEIAPSALGFVNEIERRFEDQIGPVRKSWESANHLLRGRTQAGVRCEAHVPEIYKSIEALAPRIQEAIHSVDPWIVPVGRDLEGEEEAAAIRQFLRFQLDQAGFKYLEQPTIRTSLVYGFFAIKYWWDVRFEKRVIRDWEEDTDENGDPIARIKPLKEDWRLVYEGVRLRQVNPIDFLIDLDFADPRESPYLGDSTLLTFEEIERMAEEGLYSTATVEDMRGQNPQRRFGMWNETARWAQTRHHNRLSTQGHGSPVYWRVTELWALWSPRPGEPAEEHVLTVADGRFVLQVRKNPYDTRRRPYAVGRIAIDGFEFVSRSPVEVAMPLNRELDRHRHWALIGHGNSILPVTMVDTGNDQLPKSLADFVPGELVRTDLRGPSPIQQFRSTSTIGDQAAFESIIKKDIEEVLGAPRLYMGTQSMGGDTATEFSGRQQEANRRLAGPVAGILAGYEDLMQGVFELACQYAVRRQTFEVLGEDAQLLGPIGEIGPAQFKKQVRFVFPGYDALQSLNLRGTQFMAFMNAIGPLLPLAVQMGLLPVAAWLRAGAKAIFRDTPLARELVHEPRPVWAIMPADQENVLLSRGRKVSVHEDDDDESHLREHMPLTEDGDPKTSMLAAQHVAEHIAQLQRKQAQQPAAERESLAHKRPRSPEEGVDTFGAMDRPEGGKGLNGRTPDLFGVAPAQNPGMETPGPESMPTMGSSDRRPSIPQRGNRA